jgi:hypothetical protein
MDIAQWHLLQFSTLYGAPVVFAIFTTAAAWRSISHRGVFAAVALLTFLGLSALIYPGALRYFPFSPTPVFNALTSTAALVALIGFPLLLALRHALRRT